MTVTEILQFVYNLYVLTAPPLDVLWQFPLYLEFKIRKIILNIPKYLGYNMRFDNLIFEKYNVQTDFLRVVASTPSLLIGCAFFSRESSPYGNFNPSPSQIDFHFKMKY